MNPSMTPTSPAPILAISFPPVAAPFPDAEAVAAVAAEPVAVVFCVMETSVARSRTCPKLGSGTSPSTIQPLTVAVGHAGGFLLAV